MKTKHYHLSLIPTFSENEFVCVRISLLYYTNVVFKYLTLKLNKNEQ